MYTIALFTYGTLQLPVIQQKLFGRRIEGNHDTLHGYRVDQIPLNDEGVIREIGCDHYRVILPDNHALPLPGQVLMMSEQEISIADDYEGECYQRVQVTLASGNIAWVYQSR